MHTRSNVAWRGGLQLRLGNHLLVQMGALAMAWHINLRTCVGWGAALLHQQQGGPPADGAAASPLTALYSQAPIFVDAVKACNRLTGGHTSPVAVGFSRVVVAEPCKQAVYGGMAAKATLS